MVFSGTPFLYFYLPVVLAIYYITPLRFRNGVLLVFNLIFYGWGEPVYLAIMLLTISINHGAGLLIGKHRDKGKPILIVAVVLNLGLLFFFKYWNMAAGILPFLPSLNVALPIGISFYTFQAMSYTIDVYRGDAAVTRSAVNFATYITLYPQLIAGPIVRYKDVADQMEEREHSTAMFAAGVQCFVAGLCKKILLGNNLGQLWEFYRDLPAGELTGAGAWLGIVAFTLQIYFDFSGYSDMAVGLGRMLGLEFLPNFDYPYVARSVTEFWRRWHMSLGTWFRDYVYVPLGGNQVGKTRLCFNLLLTWGLTGLWHGAAWNFLLWGLYFGVLLILEKLIFGKALKAMPPMLGHLYTLFLVVVSWVLFAVEDLSAMGRYLATLFGQATWFAPQDGYMLRSYGLMLAVAVVAATPVGTGALKRLPERLRLPLTAALLLVGMVLSTAYIVDAAYNPFLYFRF